MSITVRHGGLTVDIPEGWSDRSTLLFVGPSPLAAALPTTQPVSQVAEAVAISFVPTEGKELTELLADQSTPLRAAAEHFEVLEEGDLQSGLGQGRIATQQLSVGSDRLRQLTAVFSVGEVSVVATATTGEAGFDVAKGRLMDVLESLNRAKGAE